MTSNERFEQIGDTEVLDLLRERLRTLSDYDLERISNEAAQQLQIRDYTEHGPHPDVFERLSLAFDTLVWGKV